MFSFPSNSNFPNRTNGSVLFDNFRFIAATESNYSIETQRLFSLRLCLFRISRSMSIGYMNVVSIVYSSIDLYINQWIIKRRALQFKYVSTTKGLVGKM